MPGTDDHYQNTSAGPEVAAHFQENGNVRLEEDVASHRCTDSLRARCGTGIRGRPRGASRGGEGANVSGEGGGEWRSKRGDRGSDAGGRRTPRGSRCAGRRAEYIAATPLRRTLPAQHAARDGD